MRLVAAVRQEESRSPKRRRRAGLGVQRAYGRTSYFARILTALLLQCRFSGPGASFQLAADTECVCAACAEVYPGASGSSLENGAPPPASGGPRPKSPADILTGSPRPGSPGSESLAKRVGSPFGELLFRARRGRAVRGSEENAAAVYCSAWRPYGGGGSRGPAPALRTRAAELLDLYVPRDVQDQWSPGQAHDVAEVAAMFIWLAENVELLLSRFGRHDDTLWSLCAVPLLERLVPAALPEDAAFFQSIFFSLLVPPAAAPAGPSPRVTLELPDELAAAPRGSSPAPPGREKEGSLMQRQERLYEAFFGSRLWLAGCGGGDRGGDTDGGGGFVGWEPDLRRQPRLYRQVIPSRSVRIWLSDARNEDLAVYAAFVQRVVRTFLTFARRTTCERYSVATVEPATSATVAYLLTIGRATPLTHAVHSCVHDLPALCTIAAARAAAGGSASGSGGVIVAAKLRIPPELFATCRFDAMAHRSFFDVTPAETEALRLAWEMTVYVLFERPTLLESFGAAADLAKVGNEGGLPEAVSQAPRAMRGGEVIRRPHVSAIDEERALSGGTFEYGHGGWAQAAAAGFPEAAAGGWTEAAGGGWAAAGGGGWPQAGGGGWAQAGGGGWAETAGGGWLQATDGSGAFAPPLASR